ncbi:MAG: hypothetical protein ABSH50_07540 [Bryobacteraceae bacterium]|jgi:uncharacterized protein involved in exopolysaccharide biosynthesis
MPESVNTYRYLSFLGSRWRLIVASCAIAAGLALAVTLTQPKEYTATCRLLIEPPAGTDIRSALGVSPIYLESLKTYEHFAASDSLFLRALDRFQLRQRFPSRTVESLKARILKVLMVRDTKIMEIGVTLPDARTAHELALYLADETVKLSRTVGQEADRGLAQGAEQEEAEARARLDRTEAAWSKFMTAQPIDALQQNVQNGGELKSSLQRQLLRAEVDGASTAEALRKQLAQVEKDLAGQEELLARRTAERERLEIERNAAQDNFSTVEKQLSQVRGDLGYRGERLQIIDPGIVPERPSAPNIPVHVLAALLLGLIVPVIYLTLELSYRMQRTQAGPVTAVPLRPTGTSRDE